MAVGSSNDFDLVVLGAGTGGYAAAFRAAQLGLRVALVDEDKIGGTCLHRGCIPTKALLESAAFADKIRHAKDYGMVLPGEATVDYAAMAARRDQVVKRMWTGLKTLVDKNKVTWVQGRGRLEGPQKVRVMQAGEDGTPGAGGERILQATDVIIATGSRVKSLPGLEPDGKRIVTSDEVLKMDALPKDIIIVGAGAVGVEFASMFHDVGVKVTLLEYLPQIVPLEDGEVSKALERSFTKRGMTVMTNARFDIAGVKASKTGVSLTVGPEGKDAAEVSAELLLVATGRAANIEDIGLETTKVETDRGIIKVNGHMRTKEPHVYAVGDIVGGLWLAHTAAPRRDHRGPHDRRRVRRPRDGLRAAAARDVLPARDRLDRPDRGAGARSAATPSRSARSRSRPSPRRSSVATTRASSRSSRTRRRTTLLGVHIIGPHATDLIAEASVATLLDATPWEIGLATHAHPTLSEILGEAAMAVDGRSINF